MPPLTRKTLDKLTCQAPGCTHEDHDGLVLHGRCHIKSASLALCWPNGIVAISCKQCGQAIAEIELHAEECSKMKQALTCTDPSCKELPENHSMVLLAQCHPKAGVFITYQAGKILVACGKCETVCSQLAVAAGEQGFVS